MSGFGSVIRVRPRLPDADAAARITAALRALPRASGFLSVSAEPQGDLLAGFSLRASAHGAWRTVTEATARVRVAAEAVVWSGPHGTTTYGDTPALSHRLLTLIASGAKTASCGALGDYLADGEPVPAPGAVVTVLDHTGQPALRYRVTEVRILPFAAIPPTMALAEGEGHFDAWLAEHMAYFARTSGFDPEMPIVFERFALLGVLCDRLRAAAARGAA